MLFKYFSTLKFFRKLYLLVNLFDVIGLGTFGKMIVKKVFFSQRT